MGDRIIVVTPQGQIMGSISIASLSVCDKTTLAFPTWDSFLLCCIVIGFVVQRLTLLLKSQLLFRIMKGYCISSKVLHNSLIKWFTSFFTYTRVDTKIGLFAGRD